jgi:hypothetical protein
MVTTLNERCISSYTCSLVEALYFSSDVSTSWFNVWAIGGAMTSVIWIGHVMVLLGPNK